MAQPPLLKHPWAELTEVQNRVPEVVENKECQLFHVI